MKSSVEPDSNLVVDPLLTIAIPTFNRRERLKETLSRLAPQTSRLVNILIVDNASEYNIAELVSTVPNLNPAHVSVIVNNNNIGVCANICKCIDICNTRWIWIVPDDDKVRSDAVENVLRDIYLANDCQAIYYNTRPPRSSGDLAEARRPITVESFLSCLTASHAVNIWLVAYVFDTTFAKRNLRYGNLFSYSYAPQFAILLAMLAFEQKPVLVKLAELATYNVSTDADAAYNIWNVSQGLPIILDFPMSRNARKILGGQVQRSMPSLLRQAKFILDPFGLYINSDVRGRVYLLLSAWDRIFWATWSPSIPFKIGIILIVWLTALPGNVVVRLVLPRQMKNKKSIEPFQRV